MTCPFGPSMKDRPMFHVEHTQFIQLASSCKNELHGAREFYTRLYPSNPRNPVRPHGLALLRGRG